MNSPPESAECGIVVIGRNEGRRLIDCLKLLTPYSDTVVYVDSGSTDGSAVAAEKLGASVVQLDMTQPFTAARARNVGYSALKARRPSVRFVQFVDGDCELVPTWLSTSLPFIRKQNDIAVVCGRRRERYPERSIYNQLCDIEWNSPVGEASACGGDSLMRVDAFEIVGGFNPKIMAGEELEICSRLRQNGWRIWRLDAEMTRHDAAILRFRQWWARSTRSGYGFAELASLKSAAGTCKMENRRTIFWGFALPVIIVSGALIHPAIICAALLYPLQIIRIAIRRGPAKALSWKCAFLAVLGKFAELQGMLKFYWRRWGGLKTELIEYKR